MVTISREGSNARSSFKPVELQMTYIGQSSSLNETGEVDTRRKAFFLTKYKHGSMVA
jgi:hypothetical protein